MRLQALKHPDSSMRSTAVVDTLAADIFFKWPLVMDRTLQSIEAHLPSSIIVETGISSSLKTSNRVTIFALLVKWSHVTAA